MNHINREQHITEFISDFLMGSFDTQERDRIQAHLQSCTDCRREYETLAMLWNSLGELPHEKPSAAMRERFYTALAAYNRESRPLKVSLPDIVNAFVAQFWPKQPMMQFALALLLFITGGAAGMLLMSGSDNNKQDHSESKTEISQLRDEVKAMNRMLAVSLMQQQSASERLRGITLTSQFQQPDGELTSALLEALNYDPNVNVRLAAIDALIQFGSDPNVRKAVITALTRQNSPIVQMALIDFSVSQQVQQSKPVMEQLLKNPKLNDAVKSRIEFALNELEG